MDMGPGVGGMGGWGLGTSMWRQGIGEDVCNVEQSLGEWGRQKIKYGV